MLGLPCISCPVSGAMPPRATTPSGPPPPTSSPQPPRPSPAAAGDRATGIAPGTVAPDGTVWLVVQTTRGDEQSQWLADVIGLTPSGQISRLAVPPAATGFKGDPRLLGVSSLAPDGSGGLYVRAAMGHSPNQYVIRLTADHAAVIAGSSLRPEDQDSQHPDFPGQGNAPQVPWYLPSGIAVRPGMITLSGGTNYVLAVGIG